jgi:D-alanine-D-alanine ligase-like ATP-grasp enzyme
MKIAVLHPSYEDSTAPFKEFDSPSVPDRYLPGHDYTNFQIRKTTAVRQLVEISRMDFDVVVNLCDGAWDEDRPGIEVVQALEQLGVAFTGAGSSFYDPSREAMKIACYSAGIQFPPYVIARGSSDIAAAVERLRFPLIVKHWHGYCSIGMTRNSRVSNVDQLRYEAGRMIDSYGAALIEEFIEGREFTVLVTEPRHDGEDAWALTPVEFLFPEGETFKTFDLKWKTFETMTTRAVADAELASRLCEDSILVFAALGGSGFGRCDFRMNAAGEIHLLEINPNCAVFYPEVEYGSADFILANDPVGHGGFLEHLINCALRRRDRARRPWAVSFRRDRGFGMFAVRALHRGEIVERYEGKAHVLVSRRHVEQRWRGRRRQMFDSYAWPLAGDIHVTWSDNPDDWRPINHSCDPNSWLEGLDLVARRNIAAGEEITIDYATYCGPAMAPFECVCCAPDCRGVILGTDHLLPLIHERYGDHVSEFVRSAWRLARPITSVSRTEKRRLSSR